MDDLTPIQAQADTQSMDLNLSGKVALVTGSSRGIGRAIAETLHAEGCRVALNARNTKDLNKASAAIRDSIAIAGDFTNADEARRVVTETVRKYGALDILVCNVGSGSSVPPGNETPEEWQRMFATNLWSTTNAVEAARDTLASCNGAIVCVSSICGREVVPGAPVTYSTAKAAIHAYIRGIARPLGKVGVRINAVAPGNILFEGSVWSRKLSDDAHAVQAMLDRDVALSRFGAPDEVARLVAASGLYNRKYCDY
jgi:3-oxoacyl-[acyl-carrier protein] reductase